MMVQRPFLVCIHDATPAFASEMKVMLQDLAPLVGRRLSLGVVPNWNRAWHLAAHPDFCGWLRDNADELLLHGYFHRRQRGWSPTSWLAEGSDEMSGLNANETRHFIERGQTVFIDAFGRTARGFLAPAWQKGSVHASNARSLGMAYIVGFFSLQSSGGHRISLATWSWDCGRWRWLGHVGHGLGQLTHAARSRVPTLAIHPRDLARGFWPRILRLVRSLLDAGYEPATPSQLLQATDAQAAA